MGLVSNIQKMIIQHCAIMNVSDIFEFAHEEHGKRESTVDNVG